MKITTIPAYVALLRYIEKNVCPLMPTSFMCDFETAMRKAFSIVYRGTPVHGCWFHFCQAVRRYAANKLPGFLHQVKTNEGASVVIHMCLVLPLVPQEQILEAFQLISTEAMKYGELFVQFLAYFDTQWLRKVSSKKLLVYSILVFKLPNRFSQSRINRLYL